MPGGERGWSHTACRSPARMRLNRPARCDDVVARQALSVRGTSHDLFAPRGGHCQPLGNPRNDRGKIATHIVPLYPALAKSGKISRHALATLRSRKTAENCKATARETPEFRYFWARVPAGRIFGWLKFANNPIHMQPDRRRCFYLAVKKHRPILR
jgi:hypothetical protein